MLCQNSLFMCLRMVGLKLPQSLTQQEGNLDSFGCWLSACVSFILIIYLDGLRGGFFLFSPLLLLLSVYKGDTFTALLVKLLSVSLVFCWLIKPGDSFACLVNNESFAWFFKRFFLDECCSEVFASASELEWAFVRL